MTTLSPSRESNQLFSIGLLMHGNHDHTRRIAMGAVEYQREHPTLQIVGDGLNPLISWDRLDKFDGDGLVAIANSEQDLQRLEKTSIPFVLAGSRYIRPNLSVVASDNTRLGEMAAEHLISCGLKKFLFAGTPAWDDEQLRFEGFQKSIQNHAPAWNVMTIEAASATQVGDTIGYDSHAIEQIGQQLKQSLKPCGVFCPNSYIGRAVIQACRFAKLKVPDECAILAVNDDPLLCETTDPPLSTIVQAANDIGYYAADLLDRLLRGEKQTHHRFFKPRRIAVRRSSDLLVVGDDTVEMALRWMRDNAHESVEITDVARQVDVSRRTLELKFKSVLRKTPRIVLLNMRLDVARSLLAESEIPITEIALRSGFGSSQVFSSVFKKEFRLTPTQYRVQARSPVPAEE